MSRAEALTASVRAAFGGAVPARLGVAVSGGGDSVALLHLLTRCFPGQDVSLFAATVDHGLRPEAAEEAAGVARIAAGLGVPHETLVWDSRAAGGNLQDQARRARYRLLGGWAAALGLDTVALGHTADDQAETVLMRLGRASGVTGLSAMAMRRESEGTVFLRPVLGVTRAELRAFLADEGLSWAEDPSNEDTRFERIRLRQAMAQLEPLGLTVPALAAVAGNMRQADAALEHFTLDAARGHARYAAGAIAIPRAHLAAQQMEIARRLLQHSLRLAGGAGYPPRRAPMMALLQSALDGQGGTLAGCRVLNKAGMVWICREFNAVKELACAPDALWDGHWRLTASSAGTLVQGAQVRALGPEGLAHCPDWRDTGLPRAVLEAAPAVWCNEVLIAAPAAGIAAGWQAKSERRREDSFATALSH